MSKKNKDVQVIVEEETINQNGEQVTISKLVIGKKEVGRIIPEGKNKVSVEIAGKKEVTLKNTDEGIEYIIRQWNLHD